MRLCRVCVSLRFPHATPSSSASQMKAKDDFEALSHETDLESQHLVDDKDEFLDAVFSEFCRTEQEFFRTLAALHDPGGCPAIGRHPQPFYSNGAYSQFLGEASTPSSGNPLDDHLPENGSASVKYQHQAMHSECVNRCDLYGLVGA